MLQLIAAKAGVARCSTPWRVMLLATLGSACSTPLSESECALLLDHYTAKLIVNEHPDASRLFIAEKQAAARRVAKNDPRYEFEACPSRVSRSQYECAMQAPSVDSIEQCLML